MTTTFGPVVPILRMYDVPATLRFYCEYLGCTLDWQDGDGAQPTYLLPSGAGQLNIVPEPSQPRWRWGQLGVLLLVLFLGAPWGSTRPKATSWHA